MTEEKKPAKIHLLDTLTANQIAAGEVIERPASVVKELVENAIDAGATRIEVRIFDANCEKIQVSDNGSGMLPEDMRLAVQRHATSKIRAAADLEHLTTLGFRGEALPSIASVSQMTIVSRTADAEHGYSMPVLEGKAALPEPAAAKKGTIILVERLFYNTPARRKFLKSPRTELGLVGDLMSEFAVSYPGIAFTLRQGNHRTLVTTGDGELAQAVQAAYHRDLQHSLIYVHPDAGSTVSGLISMPEYTRAQRHYHFFINGRAVRSRELATAVEEGYDTLLPSRRYPTVFLFLTLPPESIDVNVHPGKLEVKFRDPRSLQHAVTAAIRQALTRYDQLLPQMRAPFDSELVSRDRIDVLPPTLPVMPERLPREQYAPAMSELQERRAMSSDELYYSLYQGKPAHQKVSVPDGEPASSSPSTAAVRSEENAMPSEQTALKFDDTYLIQPVKKTKESWGEQPRLRYGSLHYIGQYKGTYILAAADAGLYLIDQHAAAERIMYERLCEQSVDAEVSAMLAVPLQVTLSQSEHVLLTDHILQLRDLGFILEYFGDTTYVIRGMPVWCGEMNGEDLLFAVLDYLQENGDVAIGKLLREELFIIACRSAIKANRYLTQQDVSSLFAQLDACKSNITCPHGRPIASLITDSELQKRFQRKGIY